MAVSVGSVASLAVKDVLTTYPIGTFAGFNIDEVRRTPAVYFSDFISNTQVANLNLQLTNNIIWGTLNDEFVIEKKNQQTD